MRFALLMILYLVFEVSRAVNKTIHVELKKSGKGSARPWTENEKKIRYYKLAEEFRKAESPKIQRPNNAPILDQLFLFYNEFLHDYRFLTEATHNIDSTYASQMHKMLLDIENICLRAKDGAYSTLLELKDTLLSLQKTFDDYSATGILSKEVPNLLNNLSTQLRELSKNAHTVGGGLDVR